MRKKNKDCDTCLKLNCNICMNMNEWEQGRDLMNKPNSKDMEAMIKLIKKDYGEK